jgi:hypothetical protein
LCLSTLSRSTLWICAVTHSTSPPAFVGQRRRLVSSGLERFFALLRFASAHSTMLCRVLFRARLRVARLRLHLSTINLLVAYYTNNRLGTSLSFSRNAGKYACKSRILQHLENSSNSCPELQEFSQRILTIHERAEQVASMFKVRTELLLDTTQYVDINDVRTPRLARTVQTLDCLTADASVCW